MNFFNVYNAVFVFSVILYYGSCFALRKKLNPGILFEYRGFLQALFADRFDQMTEVLPTPKRRNGVQGISTFT